MVGEKVVKVGKNMRDRGVVLFEDMIVRSKKFYASTKTAGHGYSYVIVNSLAQNYKCRARAPRIITARMPLI